MLLRQGPAYRRETFCEGINGIGYRVEPRPFGDPKAGDLLVIWNRYPGEDGIARNYASAGADVVVVENGYVGKDAEGGKLFAMSKFYHNGAGQWRQGPPGRFDQLKLEVKPWRSEGEFILVLPQRGIGPAGVAMPSSWLVATQKRLAELTKRPVQVRRHPGIAKTEPYEELRGAWAAVTWGSGAGIKALLAGIPVFSDFGRWIAAEASTRLMASANLENPFLGDRTPTFEKLSWAQWSMQEVASGAAFSYLLGGEGSLVGSAQT